MKVSSELVAIHMTFSNETKNQHFVSQSEQRLNASNPDADVSKQRIFSFLVHDRENYDIRLENNRARLIIKNLSIHDLFTFDIPSKYERRFNFENLFQRYEGRIVSATESLLRKLESNNNDISHEIGTIFTAKIIGFSRNPYSVEKILDTFGVLANYQPTAPDSIHIFQRILSGRKPHQAKLCAELGITDKEYERWLRVLFMLFYKSGDGGLLMVESIVKSLFEAKTQSAAILVCVYSGEKCLLSDRSFSQITNRQDQVGLEFNLKSNAFIRFMFADNRGLFPHATPKLVEQYQTMRHPIQVLYRIDDMECLQGFNRNAVYQCHRRVYSSIRGGILL